MTQLLLLLTDQPNDHWWIYWTDDPDPMGEWQLLILLAMTSGGRRRTQAVVQLLSPAHCVLLLDIDNDNDPMTAMDPIDEIVIIVIIDWQWLTDGRWRPSWPSWPNCWQLLIDRTQLTDPVLLDGIIGLTHWTAIIIVIDRTDRPTEGRDQTQPIERTRQTSGRTVLTYWPSWQYWLLKDS